MKPLEIKSHINIIIDKDGALILWYKSEQPLTKYCKTEQTTKETILKLIAKAFKDK